MRGWLRDEIQQGLEKAFSQPPKSGDVFRIMEEGRRRYIERHPNNIPPHPLFDDENEK
jgi:hypothetical protein